MAVWFWVECVFSENIHQRQIASSIGIVNLVFSTSRGKANGSRIVLQGSNERTRDVFLAGAFCFFSFRSNLDDGCAVVLDPSFAGQLRLLVHIDVINMNFVRKIRVQVQLILGPFEVRALIKVGYL